jgi:hypothetical protein
MKRPLIPFSFLAIVLLGCSLLSQATKAGTPRPGETAKPGKTVKPEGTTGPTLKPVLPAATNTSCNELSFFLNPDLASKIKCETVAESGGADAMPFNT